MTDVVHGPASRRIGSTGMAVHPLALDAGVFGWASDARTTAEMLDLFFAAGGEVISTADRYAGGRSEVMIGNWLARTGRRDRVVLATRVGRHPDSPGLSAAAIRSAVSASLERLGVDRIDVLSFDGEDPAVPLEESIAAVAELQRQGVVGHLGAAEFGVDALRHAVRTARRLETAGIEVLMPEYNLLERAGFERDLAPIAVAQDMGVLARMPLASGYLRGDFRSRHDRPSSPIFAGALRYVGRRGAAVLAVLDRIAYETGHNVGQVALAWLLTREAVSTPVVRVRDAAGLADLLPATGLELSPDQLGRLDRATAF